MSTFEFYDISNDQVIKIWLSFRLRYKEDCLELYLIVRGIYYDVVYKVNGYGYRMILFGRWCEKSILGYKIIYC